VLLPECIYFNSGDSQRDLVGKLQRLQDMLQNWSRRVATDNFDEDTFDPNVFRFRARTNKPPLLEIPVLTPSPTTPYIQQKPTAAGTTKYGLDLFVDPSDATNGMVGVVDVRDPTKTQRFDILIDSYTGAAPGAMLKAQTGVLDLNTGGAFNVRVYRNSVLQQTFDGTKILGAVTYSSPGAGSGSERYGDGAVAAGNNAIAIGQSASAGHASSIVLGALAASTAANQFVVGVEDSPITEVYLGEGVVTGNGSATVRVNASGGDGTNAVGSPLSLAGGKSTGNATPGVINFQTATAGASGTTLQTLSTRFSINTAAIYPATTNAYDIGTSALAVKEIYVRTLDTDGAQTLTLQRNNVTHATLDGAFNIPVVLNLSLNDGSKQIAGPTGGTLYITGGTSAAGGRDVQVNGSAAAGSSGAAGGSVRLIPGAGDGAGARGAVYICDHADDKFSMWGATAAARSTGWSVSNYTSEKTLSGLDVITLTDVFNMLCTVVDALKGYGALGA
jgi:hypothetical protein